jgi:hypothetical protein
MNSAEPSLKIATHKCCVLYEAATGKVVSAFESISYEGSVASVTDEDLERRVRDASSRLLLAQQGVALDQKALQVIFVSPSDYAAQGVKRVDLQTKRLVPAQP